MGRGILSFKNIPLSHLLTFIMIRLIAALDELNGFATDKGIPWDLPSDKAYYKRQTAKGKIIMGYGTYLHHDGLLHGGPEYVLTSHAEPLKPGFEKVADLDKFLQENKDVWVLGGEQVFNHAIKYAQELYITRVYRDFYCTKFFPFFHNDFNLKSVTEMASENNLAFNFQIWERK